MHLASLHQTSSTLRRRTRRQHGRAHISHSSWNDGLAQPSLGLCSNPRAPSQGQNGFVVFDSPSGFDFGPNCTARDLPEWWAQGLLRIGLEVLGSWRALFFLRGAKEMPMMAPASHMCIRRRVELTTRMNICKESLVSQLKRQTTV